METLLNQWLEGHDAIAVLDGASVSEVRERVRAVGRAQGLAETEVERLALVASELANNQLAHGRGGAVAVLPLSRGGVPGVEVIAADRGPGIANPREVLRGQLKATGSLGAGLQGVLRQADEVDFDVRWGEGTCVRARKYATPPPWRREVAVLGRPYPAESLSGDQATWLWLGDRLVLGVVDGLGHGPEARVAADQAVRLLRAHASLASEALLARCDASLRGTRGVALGVVHLEPGTGEVTHACVGNVNTLLCHPGHAHSLACAPGVLGLPQRVPRLRGTKDSLQPGGLLILHTDGLATRTTVDDPLLLRRHPLEVAHELLLRFGKEHDDALVLVARAR
jgi:anti-sigma regulatory factor (Ser/Thr protein kinase)